MGVTLKGRNFLSLAEFTPIEIRYLLDLAHDLKRKKRAGIFNHNLKNKNIVLLFEHCSTRTRCSFEVAAKDEGANVTFLSSQSSHIGKKESLEDSAIVLGRLYDGIEYRGSDHEVVTNLAKFAGVPVYNGLTDEAHPTQTLADLLTVEEHVKKPLHEIKIVFVGDIRNNMARTWMYGCAKLGMQFVAYGPRELTPDMTFLNKMKTMATEMGGSIEVTDNIADIKGADIIYTDIWVSMYEDTNWTQRVKMLSKFRVTMDTLKATGNPHVKFMHCMPAFHDFNTEMAAHLKAKENLDIREVTDEVFRSRHSIVYDQAENRMHTIKAVLVATL